MATKQEIEKELKIALEEVGEIVPYFDKEVGEWVFSHPLYPVECGGATKREVVRKYPFYLKDFIEERLANNLSEYTEKKTKGRGGFRPGAGRPKGTIKEPTKRVSLPKDIVLWISDKSHWNMIRKLMHK